MKAMRFAIVASLLVLISFSPARAGLLGPLPYSSTADSPFFPFAGFSYFHLEDFDDHALNTPGVSANDSTTSAVDGFNGSIIDQVGLAGGCPAGGLTVACDTLFSSGVPGLTFTFSAAALGALPTSVGIVWTDGAGTITFEAFDQNGVSLGTVVGDHADGSVLGTIGEDRFYGATNPGGISSIHITNSSGGIEVDHLQYGAALSARVPEPTTLVLLAWGLLTAGAACRRKQPRR
jgi:PEP-CTERM motif